MPSAWPRWRPGKAVVRIAGELEKSIAAPTAWRPRMAIKAVAVGASAQSNEPTVKMAKPSR